MSRLFLRYNILFPIKNTYHVYIFTFDWPYKTNLISLFYRFWCSVSSYTCGFSQLNWYIFLHWTSQSGVKFTKISENGLKLHFFFLQRKLRKYVASTCTLLKQMVKKVKPTIFHAWMISTYMSVGVETLVVATAQSFWDLVQSTAFFISWSFFLNTVVHKNL